MKKIIAVFMASALFFSLCACAKDTNSTSDKGSDNMNGTYSSAASAAMKEEYLKTIYTDFGVDFSENVNVRITVDGYGEIELELYPEIAPVTVRNFVYLVKSGFYNGLTFHRVIDGFMIQGGDPYTRDTSAAAVAKYGQGGPGYTIPAEFVPEYTHKKGAIAAARRGDIANPKKESSGSQFYIVQDEKTCAQLNGEYTVFGETISGFEVIDRIASVATNARDLPLKEVRIKKVTLDLPEEAEGTEKAQE